MRYFRVKKNNLIFYYRFDEVLNQGWVRDPNCWKPSALFSNIKHFERWVKIGEAKVKEIKESEMFIDLL